MNKINRSLPKVLYIMGTARSGSTILEIMLSKGKNCFGAGEITSLIQDGFIENKDCSCGSPCNACSIWGKVVCAVQNADFSMWAAVQKEMDWHDGFFRQFFGMVSEKNRQLYRCWNQKLLFHIGEVTGASIVVDSSKYAGRALALQRIVGADVKVICLTRSPEGLMTSFAKANKDEQKPKKPLSALLYYVITLASLRLAVVMLGREKVFMLRYESLISDPVATLAEIGAWFKVDFSEPIECLKNGLEFEVGHVVTGNRLRKMERVQFQGVTERYVKGGLQERIAKVVMNAWKWVLRF